MDPRLARAHRGSKRGVKEVATWSHVDLAHNIGDDQLCHHAMPTDWYAILELEPTASAGEIRTAYRKKVSFYELM